MLAITAAYRNAQLALRAAVLRRVIQVFRGFDTDDVIGSWARIEDPIVSATMRGFVQSVRNGATYYQAQRIDRGIGGEATLRRALVPNAGELAARLELAGPRVGGWLQAMGRPDAAQQTLVSLSGSVGRNVMEGGRFTVLDSLDADREAIGFARVTGPKPCAFCAMLASRGPAYKDERTGRFTKEGKVYHPHCGCEVEPVYSESDPWPGRAREFRDLWYDSGGDARAFRRSIEAAQRLP